MHAPGIMVIKSRMLRWMVDVADVEEL